MAEAESVRVVVGVNGSPSSLAALRHAVAEARRLGAELVPVLAWHAVGGEFAYRSHPCPPLLAEWKRTAHARMDAAFADGFGGYPADLRISPMVIRDEQPGRVLVQVADRPGDLLIVSTGRQGRLSRLFHGAVSRYCLAHAHCAVTAVPPSPAPSGTGGADRPARSARHLSAVHAA